MSTSNVHRPGLKTWSALKNSRKRPSEYEIVSYKLHCRTRKEEQPYELSPSLPMNNWYREKVFNSPLQHPDWDAFRDPDELTYRAYCAMQDGQEEYVDGLLSAHADNKRDSELSAEWVSILAKQYAPARFLMSAAQMASAYVVQMAPASTITNCAVFQEADSYRWLSRIAYRTRELANTHPDQGLGENERNIWENAPEWQGFRELFEKSLGTFDWGEHFIALNLVALRALDFGFVSSLKEAAYENGDALTSMLCDNQARDCARSRRWTKVLVEQALEQPANRDAINGWLKKWAPLAFNAISTYCAGLPKGNELAKSAQKSLVEYWSELGLEVSTNSAQH